MCIVVLQPSVDLQHHLQVKGENLMKKGLHLQPHVVALAEKNRRSWRALLLCMSAVCTAAYYATASLVEAVDICVKCAKPLASTTRRLHTPVGRFCSEVSTASRASTTVCHLVFWSWSLTRSSDWLLLLVFFAPQMQQVKPIQLKFGSQAYIVGLLLHSDLVVMNEQR